MKQPFPNGCSIAQEGLRVPEILATWIPETLAT